METVLAVFGIAFALLVLIIAAMNMGFRAGRDTAFKEIERDIETFITAHRVIKGKKKAKK